MDGARKVDLLLIKKYLQQADYAAKESAYFGDFKNDIRQAITNALRQVNIALRDT